MSYLLDYSDEKTMLPNDLFDDISNIVIATVKVFTGDEILEIIRKDGSRELFSTYDAVAMFDDGYYDIIVDGSWSIDRDVWDQRKTSYDFYNWR